MLSGKKLIVTILSIIIINSHITFAGWKEDAKAIDISGGEDHTIVLTANKSAWTCGANGGYDNVEEYYYSGVLGTGSADYELTEETLVAVHGGDMGTTYLQDITDIDAGWKHSLALDVNGLVWVILVDFVDESAIIYKSDTGAWPVLS